MIDRQDGLLEPIGGERVPDGSEMSRERSITVSRYRSRQSPAQIFSQSISHTSSRRTAMAYQTNHTEMTALKSFLLLTTFATIKSQNLVPVSGLIPFPLRFKVPCLVPPPPRLTTQRVIMIITINTTLMIMIMNGASAGARWTAP